MTDAHADVIVVGAGLAGMTCARALHRSGFRPLLLEASDAPGGRVRTDVVDGLQLDRGFQVLLSAYPVTSEELDYARLDLQPFESGALVRVDGAFHRITDPFRRPQRILETLMAPVGTLADKLRIARLALRVRGGSVDDLFRREETTTRERLRELGFSRRMIEAFFRPFLGGVFLDPELTTSSRMFEFVFRMFASGPVTVPAGGMGAISEQIAADLPEGCLRRESPVRSVTSTGVTLDDGEHLRSRAVVLATDASKAHRLAGVDDPGHRSVLCLYYTAPEPPRREGILVLDGEGRGPVTNLALMSRVAPSYASAGRELISASVLDPTGSLSEVRKAARAQLRQWFGSMVDEWEEVATYRIEAALPDQSPRAGGIDLRPLMTDGGLYLCGDYRRHGSIEGAISSARETARAVAEALAPTGDED